MVSNLQDERNHTIKRSIAVMTLIGVGGLCCAADESQEPPLKYNLLLNGTAHELVLDKPVNLQGDYKNPNAALRASATRQFTCG